MCVVLRLCVRYVGNEGNEVGYLYTTYSMNPSIGKKRNADSFVWAVLSRSATRPMDALSEGSRRTSASLFHTVPGLLKACRASKAALASTAQQPPHHEEAKPKQVAEGRRGSNAGVHAIHTTARRGSRPPTSEAKDGRRRSSQLQKISRIIPHHDPTRHPNRRKSVPHKHVTETTLKLLSSLDDSLVRILRNGDIAFVRVEWLLMQPPTFQMPRRQDLEKLKKTNGLPSPLLSVGEAEKLIRSGERAVGVLSYGWLSPGSPDPTGERMKVVRSVRRRHTRTRTPPTLQALRAV